ncbi:MAG: 2-hydroxychromene-2-carboxylate isomerase [Parvibaculaceae bacterium]|nr:2-hydroxychromene-2-carboxylate isomerase [Parvibaculaceae bacterium]
MEDIDYYFSTLSTWSYVGSRAFRDLAKRCDVKVHHKPTNLLTLFEATGGLPAGQRPPQRQAWRKIEMKRWSTKRGLPMNFDPAHWPVNPRLADGAVLVAIREAGEETAGQLADALMRAVWEEERNIADPEMVAMIANENGLDGAAVVDAASRSDISDAIKQNTQEAIDRGLFGAPSYCLGNEFFWGQDRLDMLEDALKEQA